jgi:hypothetical protein
LVELTEELFSETVNHGVLRGGVLGGDQTRDFLILLKKTVDEALDVLSSAGTLSEMHLLGRLT